MTWTQYWEAKNTDFPRIRHDTIDAHDNSLPIPTVLHQNGFLNFTELILCLMDYPDTIDTLVYRSTEGEPSRQFNYVHQVERLKWFVKWERYLMVRNNNMPLDLDQWNTLNRDGFHEFIISSGGQVQKEPITLYEKSYLNAGDDNSSKGDNILQSPLAPRTVVQERATSVAIEPPLINVSIAEQADDDPTIVTAKGSRPSAHGHEQEQRLAPIGGERSFIALNGVNKVVRPRRSHEGEPIRTSTVRVSSHHVSKLPKLSVKGEPHEGDTIPTDTLADDDPTIVIAVEENTRLHVVTATELADDDSIIEYDIDDAPLYYGTAFFHEIRSYALSVLKRCDDASKNQKSSASRQNTKRLNIKKTNKYSESNKELIQVYLRYQARKSQHGERNVTTADITAAETIFVAVSPIADVAAITAPSRDKIMISTLADDDPTSIDGDIKHSSSKNSKTRTAVDDLANIVNTATKDSEMRSISAPMITKVADDDPVSPVDSAAVPPITMVAISTLADDDPSTIGSTTKRALSSTPRGKCTDSDSSIIVATVTPSPNKVDTATLADDDPPITTCAVSAYTSPTSTWYSLPIGRLPPCSGNHNSQLYCHGVRETIALLSIQGENNPIVQPTG